VLRDLFSLPWVVEALEEPAGRDVPYHRLGARLEDGSWLGVPGLQQAGKTLLRVIEHYRDAHNAYIATVPG